MSEWKPIDTAPKDGSTVLMVDAAAKLPEAATGCWRHDKWCVLQDIDDPDGTDLYWVTPTHWMPLPEPPHV